MKSLLAFIAPCLFLFIACETEPFEVPEERVRTYLHFLNAYPGTPSIDIAVTTFEKKQPLASGLGFMESWPRGGYASLLTVPEPDTSQIIQGGIKMEVKSSGNQEVIVDDLPIKLSAELRSTLLLADSVGKPILVKTVDNIPPSQTGTAYIRFLNVNFYNLSVSLMSTDSTVRIQNLNYLNYSSFRNVPIGQNDYYFVDDFNGQVLDSVLNVNLRQNDIYSFFLTSQGGKAVGGVEKLE